MIDFVPGRIEVPKQFNRMDYVPESMYTFRTKDAEFPHQTMESLLLYHYDHLVKILQSCEKISEQYIKQFKSPLEYIQNLLIVVSNRRSIPEANIKLPDMNKHVAWLLLRAEDQNIWGVCHNCFHFNANLTHVLLLGGYNNGYTMLPVCKCCSATDFSLDRCSLKSIIPFKVSSIFHFQGYKGSVTDQRQYINILRAHVFHKKRVRDIDIFNLLKVPSI